MGSTLATTFALRFIAGQYKGGSFPLRPNREIIIGRGSEFDMVLDEDMVSRRHTKIATYHGQIVIQDLKSTNGTFVNGERVTVARLKVGDRILVGSSLMEIVTVDGTGVSQVPRMTAHEEAPKTLDPPKIEAALNATNELPAVAA
ncbi:FHA domain-containing protein, partial [Myxococcota bacterium]|nr:FHA domain-containing protein [Myxococcota bacterium]